MPSFKSMFSAALLVGLAALPFTLAAPSPTPTRPFVVRAYESPSPVGKGLSGYYLSAQKGSFYLTQAAPSPKPVLDVDHSGQAFLTGEGQIYLDTVDGHLGYTTSSSTPAGALFSYFVHLGKGTAIAPPAAVFNWIGSDNSFWFACPVSEGKYQVVKSLTNSTPDLSKCIALQLAAINA